jgi:hypothetical protein
MFVRAATFEGVDVEDSLRSYDEVLERVRPLLDGLPGWQGMLDLSDRANGKVLTLYFFDTEENMRAAEQVFDEDLPAAIGAELMSGFTGRRTAVEHYEVTGRERLAL